MEKKEKIILTLLSATLLCGCVSQPAEEEVNYMNLNVSSPAFGQNEKIPVNYTCDGRDINPQLSISGIPDGTVSLALIVEDPDAPLGTWDHWIVWNIPPTGKIEEDTVPGIEGMNSFNKRSYGGPCPPFGTHKYIFSVYALDTQLALGEDAGKKEVLEAMNGHILAKGKLVGTYSR
jgi:Raf kinase inhibitor-like YbhB/YbcL family protein